MVDNLQIIEMKGAARLTGFDKPTVWTIMTPLAVKTESVNLVHLSPPRVRASPLGIRPNSTRTTFTKPSPPTPTTSTLAPLGPSTTLMPSRSTTSGTLGSLPTCARSSASPLYLEEWKAFSPASWATSTRATRCSSSTLPTTATGPRCKWLAAR